MSAFPETLLSSLKLSVTAMRSGVLAKPGPGMSWVGLCPTVPKELSRSEEPLPSEETLRTAQELVAAGRPFAAHEVLEARWKAGPAEERDLWQGLAQVCVAITHAARGNRTGAERLSDRAATRLAAYAATGRRTYGADLNAVMECARRHVGG